MAGRGDTDNGYSRGARRRLLLPVLLLGLALAPQAGAGESKKLYRWVDEKGQVHFGDKLPPQDAKQGRETLNRQGLVTGAVPREPTAEELEQQRAAQAAREESARRAVLDNTLLLSYTSVAELQAAREERISTIDGRAVLARKAVADNEKVLEDLRARAGDKPPPPELAKQIEAFEASLVDNLQLVQRLGEERSQTEAQFSVDIERFKLLRSGKIKPGD